MHHVGGQDLVPIALARLLAPEDLLKGAARATAVITSGAAPLALSEVNHIHNSSWKM